MERIERTRTASFELEFLTEWTTDRPWAVWCDGLVLDRFWTHASALRAIGTGRLDEMAEWSEPTGDL